MESLQITLSYKEVSYLFKGMGGLTQLRKLRNKRKKDLDSKLDIFKQRLNEASEQLQ